MSKKKKRLDRTAVLLGLQTMPRTNFQSQPRETLKSFQHKYEEDEREAQEATLAPARVQVAEYSRALQELLQNDLVAGLDVPSSFLAATCEQVGNGAKFANRSPEEIRATIRRVYSEWEDTLTEGTLTASGKQKMQACARANTECDPTVVSTWQQIFTLLRNSGTLVDQGDSENPDFIVREEPEPVAQQSFDDVLATNSTESLAGRRAIETAAMQSMQNEAADMFAQWSRLLYDTWGVILSEEQKQAVAAWFLKWNKPYRRHESWNECRRALVKSGVFQSNMILPDEALADAVENSTVPLDSWKARQDFARRARLTQK